MSNDLFVYRGSDLTDVSIVRRMPNIQTLSLRQVFAIVADFNLFYKLQHTDTHALAHMHGLQVSVIVTKHYNNKTNKCIL